MFHHYILRIIFLFLVLISTSVFAQQKKVNDLEARKKKALQEISNINGLLNESKKNTETLTTRIQLVANQIDARKKMLSLVEEEVKLIEDEQRNLESDINKLEQKLELKKLQYAQMIASMSRETVGKNKLVFMLSGNSLAESYHRFSYLRDYSQKIKNQTEQITFQNRLIAAKQDSLHQIQLEKQKVLGQKIVEQRLLEQEETKYKQDVQLAQSKTKELNQLLAKRKAQAAALDKQIQKILADAIKKQQKVIKKEKEASVKTSTDKSSAPKSISEEADIKLSGSFASNKKKFPMPFNSKYTILKRYYVPTAKEKSNEPPRHGVTLQVEANTPIKSIYEGVVDQVFLVGGYGRSIIVRHGSYFTVYGNITNIKVKEGQKVSTGQVLGNVATDPDTNISEFIFQLFNGDRSQNPEFWLKF